MLEYFKSLTNLAEIGQSRTSITNPLQWTMVIFVLGIALVVFARTPAWLLIVFVIGLMVVLGLFSYAYLYCMHTNPDVLRSENYHLSKMAIERGMLGDSVHGLVEAGKGREDTPKLIAGETVGENRQ
jgi:hypothetical protein